MSIELLLLPLVWIGVFGLLVVVPWAVVRLAVRVVEANVHRPGTGSERAQPREPDDSVTVGAPSSGPADADGPDDVVPPPAPPGADGPMSKTRFLGIDPPPGHTLVRAGLLLGVYLVGLVTPATLSVGAAVYLTAVFSPSLAGLLVVWLLAIVGLAVAPTTGRYVLAAVATRVDTATLHDRASEPGSERSSRAVARVIARLLPLSDGKTRDRE